MERRELTLLRATHGVAEFPRDKPLHGWVAFDCDPIPGLEISDHPAEFISYESLRMVRGKVGVYHYLWVHDRRDVVALRTQGYIKDVSGERRDLHMLDVPLTYPDAVDQLKILGCKHVRIHKRPNEYFGGFISATPPAGTAPKLPGWSPLIGSSGLNLHYHSCFWQWVRP